MESSLSTTALDLHKLHHNDQKTHNRKQYTFSLFLSQITLEPKTAFVAYISAILTSLDLVNLHHQSCLFCSSCPQCQTVIHSNNTHSLCSICSSTVQLHLNPDILAGLADETGGFSIGDGNGKAQNGLLVEEQAWEKLFGRNMAKLVDLMEKSRKSGNLLRLLRWFEWRLTWLRLTFVVGWTGREGLRPVVLDILPQ